MSKKSKNARKVTGRATKQAKVFHALRHKPLGGFGEHWQWEAPVEAEGGPLALVQALANRDAKAVAAALDQPNLNKLEIACYTGSGPVANLSALHVAAYHGDLEIVEVLLNAGFDPNARSTKGSVPLHHTADPRVIKALVAAGANVNAVEITGMSPLMTALVGGKTVDVVHALLAADADPDLIGGVMQESALSLAKLTGNQAFEQVLAHVTTVQAPSLTQPPYTTVGGGFTMLHNAAALGNNNQVKQCLQMGASPEALTEKGLLPFHIALLNGHRSTARLLFDAHIQSAIKGACPATDDEFDGIAKEFCDLLAGEGFQLSPMAAA